MPCAAALAEVDGPLIVALQAGNLHSGSFDPFAECIDHRARRTVPGCTSTARSGCGRRRRRGCGTWSPAMERRRLVGHRRAQDAEHAVRLRHRDRARPGRAARCACRHARQLPDQRVGQGRPAGQGARAVAAGPRRAGVGGAAVARPVRRRRPRRRAGTTTRRAIADGIAAIPGAEILNDVVYTQVSVSFGSDERTRAVTERLLADGTAWMSGSRWRGRDVLRVSVSNWSTDAADVAASVAAVRRAAAATA